MAKQVLLDALPPVLVLHLERFLYDATAGGMAKINKPIEFSPELEIPPGTTFSFLSLVAAEANNPSWLSFRNHGTHSREIHGACAL